MYWAMVNSRVKFLKCELLHLIFTSVYVIFYQWDHSHMQYGNLICGLKGLIMNSVPVLCNCVDLHVKVQGTVRA